MTTRPTRAATFLVALAGALLLAIALPTKPAGALTNDEKFITAVYEDFVLRPPTDDEYLWWTAYLAGSGSKTAMVQNVLELEEFEYYFVLGASNYYSDTNDAALDTVFSTLTSTEDFVAAEVALLAGSTFYSAHGSTNTGFVTALYDRVLLRTPDASGLAYWVGRLDAATATRAYVASVFVKGSESGARRVGGMAGASSCSTVYLDATASLAAGSYCLVLDRMAFPSEASYWVGQLSGSNSLPTLWSGLAGSAEYYTLAQSRF